MLNKINREGLPDAFILGENFIGKSSVSLILGDNFFYGQYLTEKLKSSVKIKNGVKVFFRVRKPFNMELLKQKITKLFL